MNKTLIDIIKSKSNNYNSLLKIFKAKYSKDLVLDSITNHKLNKSTTLSIIIPYYDNLKNIHKTLLSINFQENIDFKNIEVIIINDGGKIVDFILNFKYKFKLIIINNFNNFGAAISRNIGCAYSKKKYLLFLDSDVVLESNYLYQHLLRHQNFKNIITLSLYKTIKITDSNIFDYKIKQSNLKVKKLNDFRWNINLNTLLNKKLRKRKILNLMKETNYFKDFGFGKKIEYWSLPNMITTSNLMVSKNTTNAVGGFDSCFKFAQWEDTAIGAKFIATNQIVIPCLATNIFKIHHRRKYNFKKYFFENESEYNALLQKPIRLYSKSYLFKKYLSKKYIKNIITIKGVYCAYNKN